MIAAGPARPGAKRGRAQAGSLRDRGYILLRERFDDGMMARIEAACATLEDRAGEVLRLADGSPQPEFDARGRALPITVAERESGPDASVRALCRIEQLCATSTFLATAILPLLAQRVLAASGFPVTLFKDKYNLKPPGGGAFGAHQDMAAYRHFEPRYHVTAAVAIDGATPLNGCMEVAGDYLGLATDAAIETPMGSRPLFPHHSGGPRNGEIVDDIADGLAWIPVPMPRGSILLFDSFIPHRSARNLSSGARRMLFFTFVPESPNFHYEAYYRAKRARPDDPIFHVATPTRHARLDEPE